MLVPHLYRVLFEITLPKMQLSLSDTRIWREDPVAFVRGSERGTDIGVRRAASDLLESVCKRKD